MNPKPAVPAKLKSLIGLVKSQNIKAEISHLFIEEAIGGAHDYAVTIKAPKINMASLLLTGSGFRILNMDCERIGENVVATLLVTVWDLK